MFALRRSSLLFVACFLLVGCASAVSETRSIISAADLPATKYRSVVVFAENIDESERSAAEQFVVSALQGANISATSGKSLFEGRQLDEREKTKMIQDKFDAVLYVNVAEKGLTEQRVENVTHNGQYIVYRRSVPGLTFTAAADVTEDTSKSWILKDDGSVYEPILALKLKSDLQDTRTSKLVWTAETITTGKPVATTMPQLFDQASKQMVAKMREDHAI
jgi:hypothetical protein